MLNTQSIFYTVGTYSYSTVQLQYSVQFAYDQFDHRASNSASVYIEAF